MKKKRARDLKPGDWAKVWHQVIEVTSVESNPDCPDDVIVNYKGGDYEFDDDFLLEVRE